MSITVHDLVASRVVGSSVQKAVLMRMASRSDRTGAGCWESKPNMAAVLELSERSVRIAVNELAARGLVREAGKRKCASGFTIVYDLDLAAIRELPEVRGGKEIPPSRGEGDSGGNVVPPRGESDSPHGGKEIPVNRPCTVLEPSNGHSRDLLGEIVVRERGPTFADFWSVWPLRKQAKQDAEKAWKKLSHVERRDGLDCVVSWAEAWRAAHPGASDMKPATFLNGRRWRDELSSPGLPAPDPDIERWRRIP